MTSRLVWRVPGVRREAGFSLVETLVAMVLTLLLATSLFGFVAENVVWSRTQPAAIDIQARARAAIELMTRDLVLAGAGVGAGEQRGTLVAAFAPVVPRRIGVRDADLVDVARADAISMSDVPGRAPAAVLRDSLSGTAPWVVLDTPPPCPLGDPMCGLRAGDPIVVFDGLGHHDFFVVGTPSAGGAPLQYREPGTTFPYAPGAVVAPVESHVYYFDARARQLRHYDGYGSDVPVIDDVVDVRFEYFGDPDPPTRPRPPIGVANCLHDATGTATAGLATLAADDGSLARLPLASFTDGPWCGEGASRFDADLLRIRRIRVAVRVQAAQDSFRAAGPGFLVPGSSRGGPAALADFTLSRDIVPRNLDPGR